MEVWNGTGWHYSKRFHDVATAVYAQLPLFDNYQWRLMNLDMVWDHWAVKEIAFYTLVECADQVTATPIAAGLRGDMNEPPAGAEHPPSYAHDRNIVTEWWSPAVENLPRTAWHGIFAYVNTNVRCASM